MERRLIFFDADTPVLDALEAGLGVVFADARGLLQDHQEDSAGGATSSNAVVTNARLLDVHDEVSM